jgi:3-oxoadipate enol-lactonase
MTRLILTTILATIFMNSQAQKFDIVCKMAKITVYKKTVNSYNTPIIFLHGVYFDHHLWDKMTEKIFDRTVISLDMPHHGESKEIFRKDWNLNDCADMLLEILDSLQIPKVIAIGHSWGSMSILRAASKQPERFEKLLLCNMPFKAASKKQKMQFRFQHLMLVLKNFYIRQAANSLFGKKSLKENPQLYNHIQQSMSRLSEKEIKLIDKKVILDADDASDLIQNLKVSAIALKGEEDYVPAPPNMETIIIKGGHISPLECPNAIWEIIKKLL